MTSKQRYDRSEKGRATNKRAVRRYIKTAKGKHTRKIYQQTTGKEAHRVANKKYDKSVKGQINQRLWNKGLSEKEKLKARSAWEKFDGRCACCGSRKHKGRGWNLDHKYKKFRGILCGPCNFAAGQLADSIKRCYQMIRYLRRTT